MKITLTPINVRIEALQQKLIIYTSGCIYGGSSSGGTWGGITGNLSDQTDLQGALDLKADSADLGSVATSNDYDDLDNKPDLLTKSETQITLTVADWNANSQTITVVGITSTTQVTPVMDRTNRDLYSDADIVGTNGTGEIVFTCIDTPTSDIIINLDIVE